MRRTSIFREEKLRLAKGSGAADRLTAIKAASIESAAALGFIGAVGACGGYLIPRSFGASIAATGGPDFRKWAEDWTNRNGVAACGIAGAVPNCRY